MEWFSWADVNWFAVILSTVAAFVVGATWYHPKFLGRIWMHEVGLTEADIRQATGAGPRYGLTALAAFFTAVVMCVLMAELGVYSVVGGILFGLVLGLVFRLGTHVIHNGFQLRSLRLSLIDGGHDMVAMAAAGAIIGAFL